MNIIVDKGWEVEELILDSKGSIALSSRNSGCADFQLIEPAIEIGNPGGHPFINPLKPNIFYIPYIKVVD